MHISHLARTENELFASPLEDKLRFVFREHMRGAVVLFGQLFLPLQHLAGEANDHIVLIGLSVDRDGSEGRAIALEISYSHSDCTASAKSYSQMTPRSSGAHRDAAQQRVAGVFIPVGTWLDRVVCSDGGPTDFFPAPLGRRFELIDERSETRRHRLR